MFHCIDTSQFDRDFLEEIGRLTDRVRKIAKDKAGADWLAGLLSHKRAMLYFAQPSTRTYLSFLSACQILGMKTADVRDTSTSSEVKGESEFDTVRTFSSYYDAIIMRHHKANFARQIANMLDNTNRPVPVLNGGSGKDQHPTQALLDIYTLMKSFEESGGVDYKKVAFVGDLRRGRTARSLAYLLTRFEGVKQYFVAPDFLQIDSDIISYLDERKTAYELVSELDSILPEIDAIYMTRLQDEWDNHEDKKRAFDAKKNSFTQSKLAQLKANAVIMHPLPRREEISAEVDKDPRAMYWRQVRNGMWVRVALLARIFEADKEILLR